MGMLTQTLEEKNIVNCQFIGGPPQQVINVYLFKMVHPQTKQRMVL